MTIKANKGFSLRESLIRNGVTTEEAMRRHLAFVHGTIQAVPRLDITRYRPDPNYPNNLPKMG